MLNLYIILFMITCCIHCISIRGFARLGTCGGIQHRTNALRMIVWGGFSSGILDFLLISILSYRYLEHSFILSIIFGITLSIITYFIPLITTEMVHELRCNFK